METRHCDRVIGLEDLVKPEFMETKVTDPARDKNPLGHNPLLYVLLYVGRLGSELRIRLVGLIGSGVRLKVK